MQPHPLKFINKYTSTYYCDVIISWQVLKSCFCWIDKMDEVTKEDWCTLDGWGDRGLRGSSDVLPTVQPSSFLF